MIINWGNTVGDAEIGWFRYGGWVKKVDSIDTTKGNGNAFVGQEVAGATEGLTECGDGLYIALSHDGSRRYRHMTAGAFKIEGDTVIMVAGPAEGADWALQIRNKVAELLRKEPANSLAAFSTAALEAEIARRVR